MRITSGILRGRIIRVPRAGVRPTQDRVREAIFSMLGEKIVGARFLDLYAGSGAVGIEAWSRGADKICWVESDSHTSVLLRENVRELCGLETGVIKCDVSFFLKRQSETGEVYDIVFADPPYHHPKSGKPGERKALERGEDPGQALLGREDLGRILAPGGWIVLERAASAGGDAYSGWELIRDRTYGHTRVQIFRREE